MQVRVRPEDETAFSEVRVVGGENMMEERPTTEGLALFDTGVKVCICLRGHMPGACSPAFACKQPATCGKECRTAVSSRFYTRNAML